MSIVIEDPFIDALCALDDSTLFAWLTEFHREKVPGMSVDYSQMRISREAYSARITFSISEDRNYVVVDLFGAHTYDETQFIHPHMGYKNYTVHSRAWFVEKHKAWVRRNKIIEML